MPTRLATRAALRRLDVERPAGFVSASFDAIAAALDEADRERAGTAERDSASALREPQGRQRKKRPRPRKRH
jgi:hypothetical protein